MRTPEEIAAAAERLAESLSVDDTAETEAAMSELQDAIGELLIAGPEDAMDVVDRLDEDALRGLVMTLIAELVEAWNAVERRTLHWRRRGRRH